jgi:DNA sulfur modification protein DndE
MTSPIERIKLSQKAKEQLIRLKKTTKIEHWNILCRWAFCRSLAESGNPASYPIPQDSNLEMSWQTFAGEMADILLFALMVRCKQSGLPTDKETLNHQFRLHLHRGIGYLVGDLNLKSIEDLVKLSIAELPS